MTKKCLYCGKILEDSSVIDFCHTCGRGVFGEKMLQAIINNMEEARDKGDLCHSKSLTNSEDTGQISSQTTQENFENKLSSLDG